jgi:transcriptional regulator GlxA family with amidase domain
VQAQIDVRHRMPGPSGAGTFQPHWRLPLTERSAVTPSAHRALALLVNSMDEPPSVARLALASGLSKRTLHRVVRREFGLSPMALSRRIRLREVRAELEAPRPETTVTVAAFRWGFTHLGRFAGEYAREFEERPSETLRRARDGWAPRPRT